MCLTYASVYVGVVLMSMKKSSSLERECKFTSPSSSLARIRHSSHMKVVNSDLELGTCRSGEVGEGGGDGRELRRELVLS